MRPALAPFVLAARFGRGILVFGLAAGIALPELALAMKHGIGLDKLAEFLRRETVAA